MRIAVNGRFCAVRPTGVQRVARELVRRLPGSADVTLHLPRRASAAGWPQPVRTRFGRLDGPLWEQLELPWRRGRDGYDVALDPANAGPRTGDRRVLLLHDVFPVTHPEWYGAAFRRWFVAAVAPSARRAARVVMFTRWAREQAVDALGLDPARVAVLGQGVEPFDEPVTDEEARRALERFGLPPAFVLATGGGDPRKNTLFMEEVAAHLHGLPVVVVGAAYGHVQRSTATPAHEG
ncbi:MAG: hypothetical protein KY453_06275, partial [Gemmatimonadetes bacterium]|nr:hypothetical protein [Gemmatimonadota bacterium]